MDSEHLVAHIKAMPTEEVDTELTPMERAMVPHWNCLTSALVCREEGVAESEVHKHIANLLEDVQTLPLNKALDHETVPGHPPMRETIQTFFLLLEYLKAVSVFCTMATEINSKKRRGTKTAQKDIDRISSIVKTQFKDLQEHARRQKGKVSRKAIEQFVCQGEVGQILKKCLGRIIDGETSGPLPSSLVEKIHASALDTWDGVLKVKIGR